MNSVVNYDNNTDKLTGIILFLLFVSLLLNETTNYHFESNLENIHTAMKQIGSTHLLFLINSINWVISLILFIALGAAFFLGLKFYQNTLAHFIAFGFAATGLALMVTTAGTLSLIGLSNEYLTASGVETDIIAINGLSIAELRENSFQISYTLMGLSIFLTGIFIFVTKKLEKYIALFCSLVGICLIIFAWQGYNDNTFLYVRYANIFLFLVMAIQFYLSGIREKSKS